MKNKIFLILFYIFIQANLNAENIQIQSKNITIDKNKEYSIFEEEVNIKTQEGDTITSDHAEYNKSTGFIKLKKNVIATDKENNKIETQYAEYDEKRKLLKSLGPTKIITSEKYVVDGKDIVFDNASGLISSDKDTIITDQENNKIYLENFEYITRENIFKSLGLVKIEDLNGNTYEFSQIYIDTKKKEILGTDIKARMNDQDFKINNKNKPRVFANTLTIDKENSKFSKSVFTLCNYRKNDKCPPWTIQATEMMHDRKKKTIYYENAVVKVYDIPIFYTPKLSHPDPSVDRRSGFLPASISDTKNLGFGVAVPYFYAVDLDKNFTLTSKIYAKENPLFLGEYHQEFKDSNFLADFGYTEGYKNTSLTKRPGEKSHFFSKFTKNFKSNNDAENSLSLSIQDVSNDKYLKLYKIQSNLVDYNQDNLESSFNFTHENNDLFVGLNATVYETLKEDYNDKYEYILPEVTVDKNLLSNKFGNLDLQSNLKFHNYDTNKLENFLVNDFNWSSNDMFLATGVKTKVLGNLRNINYEAKNIDIYKKDTTSELYGALGLQSELDFIKVKGNKEQFLTPKILLRYSPGSMRKIDTGSKLNPINAFSMNRLNTKNNFETGLTGAIGLDYKLEAEDKDFDFSIAQIINEKENKKMASNSSLDEKLSDLVGTSRISLNNNFSINYNFALDQNYKDVNYNEIGTKIDFGALNLDFNYLQEKKHIGNQDYFKTKIDLENNASGLLSFETKRNLITNSSEFYNLSYEYFNDCLRAGLVYRREFYNDSELEPENSLMFKITLTPFGDINSPTFN